MRHQTADGRILKLLNVVDEHTREALGDIRGALESIANYQVNTIVCASAISLCWAVPTVPSCAPAVGCLVGMGASALKGVQTEPKRNLD